MARWGSHKISVLDIEPSFLTLLAFFSFEYNNITHSLKIVLDSVVFYLRLFELYSRLLGMSFYVIYSTSYYYKNLLLDFSLDFWHLYQIFLNSKLTTYSFNNNNNESYLNGKVFLLLSCILSLFSQFKKTFGTDH